VHPEVVVSGLVELGGVESLGPMMLRRSRKLHLETTESVADVPIDHRSRMR
jgi:hypothetical protein